MVILMSKGSIEAKYGLIGSWAAIKQIDTILQMTLNCHLAVTSLQ